MSAGMLHEKHRRGGKRGSLLIIALLLSALALIAAACGGGDDSSPLGGAAEGTVPAGASLLPGDLGFYAVVNTDFDSEQWLARKLSSSDSRAARVCCRTPSAPS